MAGSQSVRMLQHKWISCHRMDDDCLPAIQTQIRPSLSPLATDFHKILVTIGPECGLGCRVTESSTQSPTREPAARPAAACSNRFSGNNVPLFEFFVHSFVYHHTIHDLTQGAPSLCLQVQSGHRHRKLRPSYTRAAS